jgi:ribosomal protein L11 methyltransferase
MAGPVCKLHIYEVEGRLSEFPDTWGPLGFMGCWEEAGYSFLFFSQPQQDMVEEFLGGRCDARLRASTVLPYEDWEAGAPLHPFRAGPLLICPAWEVVEPGAGEKRLVLDPGVSFGSGYHPSTRSCLDLLVRLYRRDSPQRVLDLGTGSGILALAAARLGARRVIAVDQQPLAVETALANVRLNRLEEVVEVRLGDAMAALSESVDLIVANLQYDILCDIIESREACTARWSILSGLVGGQAHRIQERLKALPARVEELCSENLWFSLLLSTKH